MRRSWTRRGARGVSQSAQLALLWPLLLLVTLGIIEAGIWLHGRNVVQRAALVACDTARGSRGDAAGAERVARQVASAAGVRDVSVLVTRGAERVEVEVSGRAPLLLDLGLGTLHETATAPVERVTDP